MYNIELTQQSNVTAYHTSYYYPILWTRKLRPTPHSVRESHKDTLLVRVGALVQTQVYLTPKPGPFPPSRASYVACHLLLPGLLYERKSHLFNKTKCKDNATCFFWTCMAQDWVLGRCSKKCLLRVQQYWKTPCNSTKLWMRKHSRRANSGQNCSGNDLCLDSVPWQKVSPRFFNCPWFISSRTGLEENCSSALSSRTVAYSPARPTLVLLSITANNTQQACSSTPKAGHAWQTCRWNQMSLRTEPLPTGMSWMLTCWMLGTQEPRAMLS